MTTNKIKQHKRKPNQKEDSMPTAVAVLIGIIMNKKNNRNIQRKNK